MKFGVARLAGRPGLFRRLLEVLLFCVLSTVPVAQAQDAASLKARHAALRGPLASNQFKRPLYLESTEKSGDLRGDIYARVEQPYAVIGAALQDMNHWCDILMLHLNVKSCRASSPRAGDTLSLNIGRKFDQPLADAYLFEFLYKVEASGPDYLQVALNAEKGPLGTSHYRIMLEAVALDAQSSFLHMSYSYASGMAARMATYVYLATTGRDKVGFSIVGHQANGQPVFIRSTRGVVERNSMRCYLAIEAYLGALSAPSTEQLEKRLNDWYAGIERYPVQLHEMERAAYLDMKHKEIQRQQALPSVAAAK